MRQWTPSPSNSPIQALEGLIDLLGGPAFQDNLLQCLRPVVPAASYSIYRVGRSCTPELFMSASLGVPDTTVACWNAYLSGPYLTDRSLAQDDNAAQGTMLRHITAQEVSSEHRSRVYEAHGVAERVSVVRHDASSIFAINFYRHAHQAPFRDAHLGDFEALAPALVALVQKQIALTGAPQDARSDGVAGWTSRLQKLGKNLSPRELEVCARMLTGMTQDGIAQDMGLSVPTVKTYRNRAFVRLDIHFRNELFALVHAA
jgi:DNA-binding CsgD family transcriptional regulator